MTDRLGYLRGVSVVCSVIVFAALSGMGLSGMGMASPVPAQTAADPQPGPGQVWVLNASSLTLAGVRFDGVVNRDVGDGQQVPALHFTVDRLEITSLVQRAALGNGRDLTVAAAAGSVSTITEGPIELYTTRLTGVLAVGGFPALPVTLSADALNLPGIDLSFLKLPLITFTNTVALNADLVGGNLVIPGARITVA